jgi:hypothetical protein
MSKPNYFQTRWEWHSRVIDFEKKFRPRLLFRPVQEPVPVPRPRPVQTDADKYNNRLPFCIVNFGGKKEYLVTLKLDNDDELYDDVEETRVFETEQAAQQCFQSMLAIRRIYPCSLLREFKSYA